MVFCAIFRANSPRAFFARFSARLTAVSVRDLPHIAAPPPDAARRSHSDRPPRNRSGSRCGFARGAQRAEARAAPAIRARPPRLSAPPVPMSRARLRRVARAAPATVRAAYRVAAPTARPQRQRAASVAPVAPSHFVFSASFRSVSNRQRHAVHPSLFKLRLCKVG